MSQPMPIGIRNLIFYIDGLRYSWEIADIALIRLKETLNAIAAKHDNRENFRKEEVSAFLDAWVIVDMCHRVRGIIQQIQGLPKKSPEIQVFLRQTAEIEDLRNHFQHFRSGIHKIPDTTYPLWGSLSWHPNQDV